MYKIKYFHVFNMTTFQHKKDVLYQNSLQGLVDPTRNDVTLSSSDYQRFKKHSPSYSSDAGV